MDLLSFDSPNLSLSFSPDSLFQILKSAKALYVLGGRLAVFVAVTLMNELYQIFFYFFSDYKVSNFRGRQFPAPSLFFDLETLFQNCIKYER